MDCFAALAMTKRKRDTDDGVAMAIEHKSLPVGGVQFHPESLMSLGGEVGLRIVENAFRLHVTAN